MKKYVPFYLGFLFLVSCGTRLEFVEINIQKPSQLTMPTSVQSIVVVDNAGKQPDDVGHVDIAFNGEESLVEVSSDSLGIVLTDALAQFMDDEKYYASVKSYDFPINPDQPFLSDVRIDTAVIKEIAAKTDADAVLSLERLVLQSQLRNERVGNGLTAETLNVFMNAKFRMYSANGGLLSSGLIYKDTISWQAVRSGQYYFQDELPERQNALKLSALRIADDMVKMFIPYWQMQNRWFYNSDMNTRMKTAGMKANNNNWGEAAIIWGELFESETKADKKAKLASNIALANEMLDDVENALNWALISFDLFSSKKNSDPDKESADLNRISVYIQELKRRIADFKTLDIQDSIEREIIEE